MKQFIILALIMSSITSCLQAQQTLKLDYFARVPVAIKNCGALYTYDSIALAKKKYILVTDFQNLGLLTIAGKQVKLQLVNTSTTGTLNVSTYKGAGYTVILSSTTTGQQKELDLEAGTLQVSKGARKIMLKIHGQSGCDQSTQEGNR